MGGEPVIVAAATPWGRAALAVVRLSGAGLASVLGGFVAPRSGWPVPTGRPRRVDVFDALGTFDDGVLLLAPEGRSYTGEPTAELTLHGNPVVVDRAVRAAVAAGARVARPGEFTRRAVLSGRLDLVEAEAVLQTIEARGDAGLRVARAGLDGRLRAAVRAIEEDAREIGAVLEARVDHPEADLELGPLDALATAAQRVAAQARALAGQQRAGAALVHGARVAIVGPVNAGKSSLLNALAGRRRSIVHETPGTTRDVVEVRASVDGLPLTLLDTAGERETTDPVERMGLELAREAAADADAWIVVLRARPSGPTVEELATLARAEGRPHIVVYNGVDAPGAAAGPPGALPTIAPLGQGIDAIGPALRRALALTEGIEGQLLVASERQRDALLAGAEALDEAAAALPIAGPTVAAELVIEALEALGSIGGTDAREAVLDVMFARFCIGK